MKNGLYEVGDLFIDAGRHVCLVLRLTFDMKHMIILQDSGRIVEWKRYSVESDKLIK